MVYTRLAVALGAGVLLASCQGEEQAPPAKTETAASAGARACDILTEAAAEKALGRDAGKLGASGGPAGLDICQYGYQGERIMDNGQATLTIHPVDIGSLRKGVTDQGWTVEPVAGLGEEAFWSKDAGLYVGKGNRTAIYLVGVGGESVEQSKKRALALATATVGRL